MISSILTIQDDLFLIETKYIDTQATGTTARTKRKEHRNKVFEQVVNLKKSFSELYHIPKDSFRCGVFTTDLQLQNISSPDVMSQSISVVALKQWQQAYIGIQESKTLA